MSRVRDLWHDGSKNKTARHPDRGGNEDAKRWLAVWLDPDGNEKTKAFNLQDAARKYAAKMEADVERGVYVDPKAGREQFANVAEKWLRLQKVGGSTHRAYESVYRNHVKPRFGKKGIKSIQPSDIALWLNEGTFSEMSASIRATAHLIVRGTLELAVADKLRHDNPAESKTISRPQAPPSPREPWDLGTMWRVIDAHPDCYRAIPQAEAGLGLRHSCALGLAEEDIDFEAGKVRIRRQLSRQGNRFVFKLPKGEKERTVPLSLGMAAALRAHIDAYPPRPYTLPWMDKYGKIKGEHTCRLMFRWHGDDRRTHDGHIIAASYDRIVWKPAIHAAGLIPDPVRDGRGILRYAAARFDGPHAARHFFSVMLQDGAVPLVGVMEFMGHSRKGASVTIAVYGHVTDETFEQARVVIDRKLFRLRPVPEASTGTLTELRKAR